VGIAAVQHGGVERFKKRRHQVLRGIVARNRLVLLGDLSRGAVENRNEGEQKNIAKKCVGLERLPKVKKFEENSVRGMASATVAPARAQMRGQRKSVRKPGQQQARLRDFGITFDVPKFVQLLSEVNFELTEKTTASGSRSHDRPPGWQAAKLPRARGASCISMCPGCSAGSGDKAGSDTRVKSMVRKRSRPRLPFKS